MEKPKRLFAKTLGTGKESPSPGISPYSTNPETLIGHTMFVVEAAQTLLEHLVSTAIPIALKRNWDWFCQLVLTAAALHDLGKATNIFQGMLMSEKVMRRQTHPVRHEILSALLLNAIESPLKDWLEDTCNRKHKDFSWLLSWAVGGHHLKLHEENPYRRCEAERLVRISGTPREFIFWGSHPDVLEVIRMACRETGINSIPPRLTDIIIPIDDFDNPGQDNLQFVVDDYVSTSIEKSTQLPPDETQCLAYAKSTLIAADVAGSALPQEVREPRQWMEEALSQTLSAGQLQSIIADRLTTGRMRPFQKRIAISKCQTTLTIAGCGNGKTLAAYAWAEQRATGRKLFFCYPTTGTASAGFGDYLLAQTDLERTLIHGRSHVDMERMMVTGQDDMLEENQRLVSLKSWSQQIVACTVDTVLGLVQNQRRALFSFPAFTDAGFVFDEIHNYDTDLFGALLRFLEAFPNNPVLLMSASIPQSRLALLKEKLGERLSEPICGEPDIEELDRYRLRWKDQEEDCWPEIQQALKEEKKVLWVCNTVPDAMRLFEESSQRNLPVSPLIYHSRFRYKDRVDRQEAVIQKFKKEEPGPAFVIATQVCEMSLDISAELMVSALAPFPSIIQRLGRLNRYATRSPDGRPPCLYDCLIYDFACKQNRPYAREELAATREVMKELWEKPCSQGKLAQLLAGIQKDEEIKTYSAWLDGRWQSDQRPLRTVDNSLAVVLAEDLPEIEMELKSRGQKPNSQNLAAWTIPMLFCSKVRLDERIGGYPIAYQVDIEYSEATGARWRNRSWEIY